LRLFWVIHERRGDHADLAPYPFYGEYGRIRRRSKSLSHSPDLATAQGDLSVPANIIISGTVLAVQQPLRGNLTPVTWIDAHGWASREGILPFNPQPMLASRNPTGSKPYTLAIDDIESFSTGLTTGEDNLHARLVPVLTADPKGIADTPRL